HVETRVAEEVELRSGEGEPADAGRDLLDPRDLDVEEAPGRGRPGGTTGAGAGCDDGQAHTGEANLRDPRRVNPSRPLDGHRSGDPRHAPRPRLRHSRYTKYGAPSRAVPRPAGICPGAMTTRPSVSATETRSAPSSIATGTTRACRAPTRARAACGATSPTNASAPIAHTAAAVRSAATPSRRSRVRSSAMPRTRGVSSSSARTSRSRRSTAVSGVSTTSAAATGTSCSSVRPYVEPESHVSARLTSQGATTTTRSVMSAMTPAWAPMPMRTSRSELSPPRYDSP